MVSALGPAATWGHSIIHRAALTTAVAGALTSHLLWVRVGATALLWAATCATAVLLVLLLGSRWRPTLAGWAWRFRHLGRPYFTVVRLVEADFSASGVTQRTLSVIEALRDGVDRVEVSFAISPSQNARLRSRLPAETLHGDDATWTTALIHLPHMLKKGERFGVAYDVLTDAPDGEQSCSLSVLVSEPLERLELRMRPVTGAEDGTAGMHPFVMEDRVFEIDATHVSAADVIKPERERDLRWIVATPELGHSYSIRYSPKPIADLDDIALLAFR